MEPEVPEVEPTEEPVVEPTEAPTGEPLTACPSCGVLASRDPLFETNHAACDACGLRNCDPAHARKAHTACSGCGLRKCADNFVEEEHMKCAGCREMLCASEVEHISCPGCHRYSCKEADQYNTYNHTLNDYGRYPCLDYPEEPEPEVTPEPTPKPTPTPKPEILYIRNGDTLTIRPNTKTAITVASEEDKYAHPEIEPNVIIGEGITEVGEYAFNQHKYIEDLQLPVSLAKIGKHSFRAAHITTLEIPKNVTFIGEGAFRDCPDLETVHVYAETISFDRFFLRSCPKLKDVYFHGNDITFASGQIATHDDTGASAGITFYVQNRTIADAIVAAQGAGDFTIVDINNPTGTPFYSK